MEEYTALLRISLPNPDKVFWKKAKMVPFRKKLAQMMNVDASLLVSVIRLKGKNKCVQCDFLVRYMIENNDDDQVIDIFGLVVYEILIFPQSLGYVDVVVVDLIKQINNQANPVPAIVVETIRSLNFCRRKGEGDFIGYAQLLYMWI